MRTRRQLVTHQADVVKQVKSKLLFHGITIVFSDRRYWSREYLEWIKGFEVKHQSLRASFDYLIEFYEHLTEQITGITEEILRLSETER